MYLATVFIEIYHYVLKNIVLRIPEKINCNSGIIETALCRTSNAQQRRKKDAVEMEVSRHWQQSTHICNDHGKDKCNRYKLSFRSYTSPSFIALSRLVERWPYFHGTSRFYDMIISRFPSAVIQQNFKFNTASDWPFHHELPCVCVYIFTLLAELPV